MLIISKKKKIQGQVLLSILADRSTADTEHWGIGVNKGEAGGVRRGHRKLISLGKDLQRSIQGSQILDGNKQYPDQLHPQTNERSK